MTPIAKRKRQNNADGRTERATVFDLLDEAAEAGIPLDTQLANYALRLLAGAKDVEGVEMLLERMRTGGVGRDVVSWTTAIKVCMDVWMWMSVPLFPPSLNPHPPPPSLQHTKRK